MKPVGGSFVKAGAVAKKRKRLIMLLYGGQKAGKTHFALSAPGPVLLFDFDKGTEGVIEQKAFAGKEIYVAEYTFAQPALKKDRGGAQFLDAIRNSCTPVWEKLVEDWTAALKSEARTIVVDTASAMFNLGKLAYVGWSGKVDAKEDPYGQKSGALAAAFGGLVTSVYSADKNIIFLAREKQVWEGGEPAPGKFEAIGWGHLPYEVQVVARISKTQIAGAPTRRKVVIVDSRLDGDNVNGMVFSDKEDKNVSGKMNFTTLASTITGTEENVWF